MMNENQRQDVFLSLLNVIDVLDSIEAELAGIRRAGTLEPLLDGRKGLLAYFSSPESLDDALIKRLRDNAADSIHFLKTVKR